MNSRILFSILLPVFIFGLFLLLKDFLQATDRHALFSLLGNAMNVLYFWPLLLLKQAGLIGSLHESAFNLGSFLSILFSLGVQMFITSMIFKPDIDNSY